MVSADQAKQLHDRTSRGEPLSSEEQSLLEEWYAIQDNIEQEALGLTKVGNNLLALRPQVETLLAQLTTVTKRIQEVAAENERLKREIAMLQGQLQVTVQLAG